MFSFPLWLCWEEEENNIEIKMSRIGFFPECNFFITVGRGWQDLFNLCIKWNTIKVWNCDKLRKINYSGEISHWIRNSVPFNYQTYYYLTITIDRKLFQSMNFPLPNDLLNNNQIPPSNNPPSKKKLPIKNPPSCQHAPQTHSHPHPRNSSSSLPLITIKQT